MYKYKYPQGGIEENQIITLQLHIKRNFMCSPKILIEKRHDYDRQIYKAIDMKWISLDKNYDLYSVEISIEEYGHYFYTFVIDENNSSESYEMLVYKENYSTPHWIKGGIIYHIFVDRFYRSEIFKKYDDIVIRKDWSGVPHYLPDEKGEIKNNDFFGGNLDGIREKLPYLYSLDITVIYLSPIFEAHSNHKYDTGDYFTIDPMFGTEKSLSDLCIEAEKYGINIILDGVFSHTGADSIYFNKYGRYNSIGAYQSEKSPYYEWYMFNNWNDDYICWWDIKILPTINKNSKSYLEFIAGNKGVIEYWQNLGVKGWRLDVADELPNDFIDILNHAVKKNCKDTYLVGEVWEDASNKFAYGSLKEYFCGNQLDSVTNYPLMNGIIDYLKTNDCNLLYKTMEFQIEKYPPQSLNSLMNIIGTHDTARILTILGSDYVPENRNEMAKSKLTSKEYLKGVKLLKIASLLQMTLPGVPCIYYGDEVGVEGWKDPFNRTCFPWGNENTEILNHYKFLSEFRRGNNIFAEGKYKCLIHDSEIFAFERSSGSEKIIIAINMSSKPVTLNLKEDMRKYSTDIINNSFDIKSFNYLILCNEKTKDIDY